MSESLERGMGAENPLHVYSKRVLCLMSLSALERYGLTTGTAEATIFGIPEVHPSGGTLYALGVLASRILAMSPVEEDRPTRQSVVLSAFP